MRPSGLQISCVWIETVWRRGRQHPKLRHPDVKGEVPSITVAGAERVTAPVGTFDAYRGEVSAAEGGVTQIATTIPPSGVAHRRAGAAIRGDLGVSLGKCKDALAVHMKHISTGNNFRIFAPMFAEAGRIMSKARWPPSLVTGLKMASKAFQKPQ
jgi:hypothetical protein